MAQIIRTISPHLINLTHSIVYFFNNQVLMKEGVTKTLKQWLVDEGEISDLPVVVGFPPALDRLTLPTLALVMNALPPTAELAYAEGMKERLVDYTLFGFVGGFAEDHKNRRLRDQLMNDLQMLMEDIENFPVYGIAVDGTLDTSVILGDADFVRVSARPIPPTGLSPQERWRFGIDFTVSFIRALDS